MYFADTVSFDYQIPAETHIIDRDREIVIEKLTKIYRPNYEKYIQVNKSNELQFYRFDKKNSQLKNSSKQKKKDLNKSNQSNIPTQKENVKDCDCSPVKTDAQDIINKIISKNYLPFKFDKNLTILTDEQKKALLNLDYKDAKKINIVSYADLETLKNDTLIVAGKRAESIANVLPLNEKGKIIIENRECTEVLEKCGTAEIRLSY